MTEGIRAGSAALALLVPSGGTLLAPLVSMPALDARPHGCQNDTRAFDFGWQRGEDRNSRAVSSVG